MDIIGSCLDLVPVPYLSTAFGILRSIWLSIDHFKACEEQVRVLAESIAVLLRALNGQFDSGRLSPANASVPLDDLCR
jgi:hypothetical protein